jgi:hypothetical protein
MRRRLLAGVALVSLVFLPAPRADATVIEYQAILLGSNENPAVVTPGTGFAIAFYDDVAHMLTVNASFSGLLGTTTAAHIHCCADPPTNAGVATQTPSFNTFPLGVTAGDMPSTVYDLTLATSWNPAFINSNGGTTSSAEAALAAGLAAGRSYFNIHTSMHPGGEIRGTFFVPEPATIGVLGFGLVALAFARTRRKLFLGER